MSAAAPDEQRDDSQSPSTGLDKFLQAYLHGAELRGALLGGADLFRAGLAGADLRGADLALLFSVRPTCVERT